MSATDPFDCLRFECSPDVARCFTTATWFCQISAHFSSSNCIRRTRIIQEKSVKTWLHERENCSKRAELFIQSLQKFAPKTQHKKDSVFQFCVMPWEKKRFRRSPRSALKRWKAQKYWVFWEKEQHPNSIRIRVLLWRRVRDSNPCEVAL